MNTTNFPSLINTIRTIKDKNQFKHYIDFIQFPYYRNLSLNTRIKFEFPLTIFLGQNGSGKSSTLHALYGSTKSKTPYEFWFDTKVDPVEYYDEEKRRHSFWYSYKDSEGKINEVVKARIKREKNPNNWETSRPLRWAGMSGDERNSPIEKNVVYIDFRAELSAFDKYFYFGNIKKTVAKNKQEFIQRKSISLKKLFDGKTKFIGAGGKNQNKPLINLTQNELEQISFILGKIYISGRMIEHSLFRNEGYSVLFQTNFAKYSEAFAGSGEMAVVRLVTEILKAPDYSLILLDEPEVSLHPGAQERLQSFLLEEIKKKKHQIIISSHSPILVKDLPPEAIKVFYQNPNDGRFIVKEGLNYKEAFFHIEYRDETYKNIHVEDTLAKNILNKLIAHAKPESQKILNIVYNPGGNTVLKKEFISVFCRNNKTNDFILFDGDQKVTEHHFDYKTLPYQDISITRLKKEIKNQTKVDVEFSIDGGDGQRRDDQQLELLKKYLDYYRSNVFYIPKKIPEDIIWDDKRALDLLSFKDNPKNELSKINNPKHDSKTKFKLLTEIVFGSIENIESCHNLFIESWLNKKNEDYFEILSIINKIIAK
jgi:predicted ATPase